MYRFVSESGHCVQDSAIRQLCIDDVVFRVPAGLGLGCQIYTICFSQGCMRRGFGDGSLQLPAAPTTDISLIIIDIATTSAILVWLSQGPPPLRSAGLSWAVVSPEFHACLCGKVGIASGTRKATSNIDLPAHESQLPWAEMCGCHWPTSYPDPTHCRGDVTN